MNNNQLGGCEMEAFQVEFRHFWLLSCLKLNDLLGTSVLEKVTKSGLETVIWVGKLEFIEQNMEYVVCKFDQDLPIRKIFGEEMNLNMYGWRFKLN